MPGEKLDLTKDEMEKLTEALKKEEFRKLLAEYAEELADPEKRKLYEEELTMLESQRGVDMKFIKPQPGFVVKLRDSANNKVFINVCSSPDIAQPEFTYAEQKSGESVQRGQQCSLPYSLAPTHPEKDNQGVECEVYDVVFNPDVLTRCSNPKFKDIVVSSALDGVCSNFKVTLDRDSAKFPKMAFKGTPSQCVIRKRVEEEQSDAFDHLPGRPAFPDLPGEEQKKKEKKGTKKKDESKEKPDDEPEYKIVFRDEIKMGNFTNERISSIGRPSQITVTISLPLHSTARDVHLDVYPDLIELHSHQYNLKLKLPYKVDSDNGKAKFDKEKKDLVVTLDVVPREIKREEIENFPGPSLVEEMPEHSVQNHVDTEQVDSISSNKVPETYVNNSVPEEQTLDTNNTDFIDCASDISYPVSSDASSLEIVPSIDSIQLEISENSSICEEINPTESIPNETLNEISDSPKEGELPSTELVPKHLDILPSENSFERISPPESISHDIPDNSPPESSSPCSSSSPEIANLTHVTVTLDDKPTIVPDNPAVLRTRFNVSPVPCSGKLCNSGDPSQCEPCNPKNVCNVEEEEEEENKDLTIPDEVGSVNSGLSSYTDCSLEDNLSVGVRVYQDMSTATVILDTVYNSVPEVTISGKKVWLENEDVTLYLIVPHAITTFTIDMSMDNVCFVVYKQHKSLWAAVHIGHSEEEVFSYKFITEENADWIVESFGDPWVDRNKTSVTPHLDTSGTETEISYTVGNWPSSIPIYSPDPDGEDPSLKGILKSPHSPPPISPRSRKVSFNEEVETFVLPSKRSIKGKKRRKNKSGSSSASESSDEASSPSPTSPLQEKEMMLFKNRGESFDQPTYSTEGLILESAEDGWNTVFHKKSGKKNKNKSSKNSDDKENVLQTQGEAVKCLDPEGAASHKMMLGNSHIYELED